MSRTSRSMLSNLVMIMALALAALAPGRATAAPSAQAQQLMFRVTATGIEGPQQAMSGLATFAVENATGEPGFGVFLVRIKEGKTLADVQAELAKGEQGALSTVVDDQGGVFGFPPGTTHRFSTVLRPGAYIVAADPEQGQLVTLEVTATAEPAAAEPSADVDVTLKDFEFVMPRSIPAGTKTWKISNAGPQVHEMVYFQLLPGKTLQDVFTSPEDAPPPFDLESLGGVPTMVAGVTQWSMTTPKPGRYVAVCFVTDPATQKPHAELGMVAEFTVGTAAGPGNLPATGEAPVPVALPDTGASGPSLMILAAALVLFGLGAALRLRRV